MLLFQRKLETVAERHLLQFEKFLGDGAFYTTRRALRLVRAAVEIQRFYSEMKRKGFAFNKGLRIAMNYGYYRLLPMKGTSDDSDRITEFYGPGIVELSRLTTGKANKEIEEIASFLVSHGYDPAKVQIFFAPLARGVDVIDHAQHKREYYAYVNENGHLVNEGIVASMPFLQELSIELQIEEQQLHQLKTPWGTYIGFAPAVPGLEFIGIRLLGMVQFKGLDSIDVGEIVPFGPGEAQATEVESSEPLVGLLRQDFHQERQDSAPFNGAFDDDQRAETTTERMIASELVICVRSQPGPRRRRHHRRVGSAIRRRASSAAAPQQRLPETLRRERRSARQPAVARPNRRARSVRPPRPRQHLRPRFTSPSIARPINTRRT